MKNTKKGFTLVELLIVIAIIAILATVSVVGYVGFIKKANMSVDQQFVDQLNTLLTSDAVLNKPESVNDVIALFEENEISSYLARYENDVFYWDPALNQIFIWTDGKEISHPASYNKATTLPEGAVVLATTDTVVADGGEVAIVEDVVRTEDEGLIITKDTTFNFGDKVIKLEMEGAPVNYNALRINQGVVTLDGKDGGLVTSDNAELYALTVGAPAGGIDSTTVTISGGKYIGGTTAINVVAGTVKITGGFFQALAESQSYVINCNDGQLKAGKCSLVVEGGTYVNFDPSAVHEYTTEGEGFGYVDLTKFVVTSETQENGDIWYTVSPIAE